MLANRIEPIESDDLEVKKSAFSRLLPRNSFSAIVKSTNDLRVQLTVRTLSSAPIIRNKQNENKFETKSGEIENKITIEEKMDVTDSTTHKKAHFKEDAIKEDSYSDDETLNEIDNVCYSKISLSELNKLKSTKKVAPNLMRKLEENTLFIKDSKRNH